jgi:hypothetical protein
LANCHNCLRLPVLTRGELNRAEAENISRASDALIVALGGSRFTWGGASLADPGILRRDYIAALQAADTDGDIQPLLAFSRR